MAKKRILHNKIVNLLDMFPVVAIVERSRYAAGIKQSLSSNLL